MGNHALHVFFAHLMSHLLAILYWPATHAKHVPPSGPVYPAVQLSDTQSATASLATGDVVPAGQVRQVDALVAAAVPEYVPAAQFVHGAVPREEYCPG
jgi:hypothetical protein